MIRFSKYHGLGNDFILIDDRSLSFPTQKVSALCHRHLGVGADGVILFQPPCKMRIFNPDGSEADSCGNGLRCFVLFLQELGIFQKTYHIELPRQIVEAECRGDQVAIQMGLPRNLRLHLQTPLGPVHYAHAGVPHVVHFVPDIETADLSLAASLLRRHPLFAPDGANVSLASVHPGPSLRVRTFERGVEAETLACGTAATAISAVARKLYGWEAPISVHFAGGSLTLDGPWMIGPAVKVFSGVLGTI